MENNNQQVEFEEDELGLDINLGSTNLFEQFHKDSAAGSATTFKTKPDEDGGGDPDKDKNKSKKEAGKTDDDKETEFETGNILNMVKDHFNKDKDDDEDKGAAAKSKSAGDSAKSKAERGEDEEIVNPETLGVFKTMYEHFTENHGYRPMKEGDFDGTAESFDKWLEDEKEELAFSAAEQLIEESFVKSPNPQNSGVALDLFKFLQNGGIVADFVETRKYDTITPEYISSGADDDAKIERSKTVMANYYNALGWDKTRVDKTIKNLETGGALLSMAEETLPEFIKMKESQKAIVEENNIREKNKNENNVKEYNSKLLNLIDTADAVGPFELKSRKEREQLKEYLFVPKVDAGNGKMIPQFLADRQKASNNPIYTLFQALTYMNKGVDLSKIEEAAADKTKKTIKEKLEGAVLNNKIDRTAGSSADQTNNQRTKISDLLNFDDIQTVISG